MLLISCTIIVLLSNRWQPATLAVDVSDGIGLRAAVWNACLCQVLMHRADRGHSSQQQLCQLAASSLISLQLVAQTDHIMNCCITYCARQHKSSLMSPGLAKTIQHIADPTADTSPSRCSTLPRRLTWLFTSTLSASVVVSATFCWAWTWTHSIMTVIACDMNCKRSCCTCSVFTNKPVLYQ